MIQLFKKYIILVFLLDVSYIVALSADNVPQGEEILQIGRFDNAIKEFSSAVEKGESQKAIEQFLRIVKCGPNREIIQKISELSGIKRLYPLAYHKDYEWSPVFSPDGTKIIYQGWQKKISEAGNLLKDVIYIMNIDGSGEQKLTDDKYDNFSPMFSPNGQFVLFMSVRDDTNGDRIINKQDNKSLHIVEVKTKKAWQIVPSAFINSPVSFTPDSTFVVFYSFREDANHDGKKDTKDNKGIYIVRTDGKKTDEMIAHERFINSSPLVSPDSKWAAYESIREDTNGDGKIDSSDNPGIYLRDISEFPLKPEVLLIPPKYKNEIAAFTPNSGNLVFFSRKKDTNKDKAINENDKRAVCMFNLKNKKESVLIEDEYDHDFVSFSSNGKKMAYTSYLHDTNSDGVIDSRDHRTLMVYDLTMYLEGVQVANDKYDNSFLAFYPDGKKILFQSYRKDTDNNGQIDVLDQPGVYIVDVSESPTMKITTLIKKDGTGSRVIEVVVDPMFKETAKYQEMFLRDKKWEIGFVQEGGYHLKAVGDFKNLNELSKFDYPLKFSKSTGLFRSIYEFKEVLLKQEIGENSRNPFIAFGKEMSRVMTKPLVIIARVTVPGKILKTNAPSKIGNTVEWSIPVGSLIKANKDFEMFVKVEVVNWTTIIILSFIVFLAIGGTGYRIYGIHMVKAQKKLHMSREYAEAHNYLGIAYKNKNLYDEAIGEYKKALSFSPNSGVIHYNMAVCYALKGDKEQAGALLQKAIMLDNSFKEKANKETALKEII